MSTRRRLTRRSSESHGFVDCCFSTVRFVLYIDGMICGRCILLLRTWPLRHDGGDRNEQAAASSTLRRTRLKFVALLFTRARGCVDLFFSLQDKFHRGQIFLRYFNIEVFFKYSSIFYFNIFSQHTNFSSHYGRFQDLFWYFSSEIILFFKSISLIILCINALG